MSRIWLIAVMVLLPVIGALADDRPSKLSKQGRISLLTCNPGSDLYAAFGHGAIRVKDPTSNLDVVYNYGTFNFDEPNFYIKFIRGKLDYYLSMTRYKYFLMAYQRERREIREQVLNLSHQEANELFAFLQQNHKPENRYYRYDFFFDNCATRIRDAFTQTLGEDLVFDKTMAYSDYTFRDLLDKYLEERRWAQFGINILLGQRTDRIAKPMEYMFLPDYVEQALDDAILKDQGRIKPVVDIQHKAYIPENPVEIKQGWMTPDILFWAIFALLVFVTVFELLQKMHFKWIDALLFITLGLAGFLISFLWWGSSHSVTDLNWNLLWAFPLHLVAGIWLITTSASRYLAGYFIVIATVAFLVLPLWGVIPQRLDPAFLPIILLITTRGLRTAIALSPALKKE